MRYLSPLRLAVARSSVRRVVTAIARSDRALSFFNGFSQLFDATR